VGRGGTSIEKSRSNSSEHKNLRYQPRLYEESERPIAISIAGSGRLLDGVGFEK
jgi:hypothetical protein